MLSNFKGSTHWTSFPVDPKVGLLAPAWLYSQLLFSSSTQKGHLVYVSKLAKSKKKF